jgi:uncharacterized protein with beta-barrel porin domain
MQFQCRFGVARAAAVVSLVACAWLAPTSRALADCQPDITTNLIVNCTAAGGTQTTTVGTGAENDRILTIQPGALIDVSPGGVGVLLDSRNIITNSGTILTGDAAGGFAGGIFLIGDDNVVINNGSIVVGDTGAGGLAFGIQVFGDRASITNNNSIVVGNGDAATLFTGGFGSAVGISVGNSSQVVNNGSITVGNFANAIFICCSNTVLNSASGLIQAGDDSVGIIAGGDLNTITNAGQIVVGNGVNYFAIGIMLAGTNTTATNTGTIRGGAFSIGMAVDDTIYGGGGVLTGNTLINAASGVIQLGDNSIGIAALDDSSTVRNFGTISVGAAGTGIIAGGDNSTVINTGTILVGAGGTGIEIIAPFSGPAGAAGAAITNSGTIIVGTGGIGVNFEDTGSLNNTGMIRVSGLGSLAINTCGCAIGVVNNAGTIDGQILLGVGSALTNSGLITVTDTDANNPVGGFAHIAGETFVQTATGTLALRVTSDGRNDSLGTASGTATVTLAGTLRALVQPGLYGNVTTYINVVTSGANITTQFDSVTSSSPFFTATAVYNPATVDLTLARIGFGSVPGMTPNQRAVGNSLEGSYSTTLTGNAATFYGNLLAATSVTVLDLLSGEGTSAAQNAAFSAGSLFNNAMQNQALFGPNLNGLAAIAPAAYAAERVAPGHEAFAALRPSPAADPGRWRVWTAGFGASQSLQGNQTDPGSASQSVRSAGGVLGVDWQAAPDLRVGVAVGGSESTFSVAGLSTSGRMTAGHIGAYAMKTWGAYYVAASLSYARFDNSTTRTITGVGPTETVSGRFDSDQLSARLELGWRQAYGRVNVTPFVAVEPSVLWQRGYTESGTGILGLTVASHTATSLPTFVGVQFDGRYIMPDGAVLAPYSRVSWVHEFEPDRRVSAAFITVPGASFTVNGARAASDAARLDTGARLMFSGGLALFASFTGEWSDHTHSYAGSGGFRYVW